MRKSSRMSLERSITFRALYPAGVRVSQQSAISRKGDAISHTALHRLAATLREMSDTRQTLLRKAAALVGREELAAGLKVAPALLDAWMNGQATVPDRKLAALADLLDDISNPPKR
jgi:hypothetical protein